MTGKAVIATVNLFSRFSGLRLNMAKSKALPIGDHRTQSPTICGLELVDKVHILGIWVAAPRSTDEHYQWNYAPALHKMRACCKA